MHVSPHVYKNRRFLDLCDATCMEKRVSKHVGHSVKAFFNVQGGCEKIFLQRKGVCGPGSNQSNAQAQPAVPLVRLAGLRGPARIQVPNEPLAPVEKALEAIK